MTTTQTSTNSRRFADVRYVHASIRNFLKRHGTRLETYTQRMSENAEMVTYNAIVDAYESLNYQVGPANISGTYFRYKLKQIGNPANFSYFTATLGSESFDILNNIALESAHSPRHYYTADIAVVRANATESMKKADAIKYGIARTHFAIRNRDIATFFEVKNVQAYPALLFMFAGLLHEITPEIFLGSGPTGLTHLAPGLVCSFAGTQHANFIASTLEQRWTISIYMDVLRRRRLNKRKKQAYRLIGDRTIP